MEFWLEPRGQIRLVRVYTRNLSRHIERDQEMNNGTYYEGLTISTLDVMAG